MFNVLPFAVTLQKRSKKRHWDDFCGAIIWKTHPRLLCSLTKTTIKCTFLLDLMVQVLFTKYMEACKVRASQTDGDVRQPTQIVHSWVSCTHCLLMWKMETNKIKFGTSLAKSLAKTCFLHRVRIFYPQLVNIRLELNENYKTLSIKIEECYNKKLYIKKI